MNRTGSMRGSNEASTSENNPTLEDQIRDYRRFQASTRNAILKLKGKKNSSNRSLEMEIDPNEQLQISNRRRANMVPAEVLYSVNWSEPIYKVLIAHLGQFPFPDFC